jgi:hypothetical protein
MKSKTKQLLDQVFENHDWDLGTCWGGGGTRLSSTDVCRVCGLQRDWFKDSQNGVDDRYSFASPDGQPITLRDAAVLDC